MTPSFLQSILFYVFECHSLESKIQTVGKCPKYVHCTQAISKISSSIQSTHYEPPQALCLSSRAIPVSMGQKNPENIVTLIILRVLFQIKFPFIFQLVYFQNFTESEFWILLITLKILLIKKNELWFAAFKSLQQ